MKAEQILKLLVIFIASYHLIIGFGLMFSHDFQQLCVATYGASFDWTIRDIYYIRVIGSFAFVLGSLALAASVDPMKYYVFLLCYIEFFILRDIHRHLYSEELYAGFSITPTINILTSLVFAVQAIALLVLIWIIKRKKAAGVTD